MRRLWRLHKKPAVKNSSGNKKIPSVKWGIFCGQSVKMVGRNDSFGMKIALYNRH